MLLGDFNAHNLLWGTHETNRIGSIMEKLIEQSDLCLLNDNSPTYLHPATGSFSDHYSDKFKKLKNRTERQRLNFTSNNMEDYNLPFTMSELHESLNKSHDTATGPDEIHYQLLKHLQEMTFKGNTRNL